MFVEQTCSNTSIKQLKQIAKKKKKQLIFKFFNSLFIYKLVDLFIIY